MGAAHLNRPVVGMVASGNGYLMVGADGGIFAFSSTPDGFHGCWLRMPVMRTHSGRNPYRARMA
jgi:hypothetical protein